MSSRTLVISAELLQRTLIRDALQLGGYEVRVAADLNSARTLQDVPPHAILVNPILPGGSAEEMLRELRKTWPLACLLLIRGERTPPRLLKLCDDFVDAELSTEFLLHRVDRALELSEFRGSGAMTGEREQSVHLVPSSRFLSLTRWELSRGQRYGSGATLVRTAIDFLGKVRDLKGDRAADNLRRLYAQILVGSARSSDLVSAWEDDGYCVLLTECGREEAIGFVRKVCGVLSSNSVDSLEWRSQTVSFGFCALEGDCKLLAEDWIIRADRALRLGQRAGRNSIREFLRRQDSEEVVALTL